MSTKYDIEALNDLGSLDEKGKPVKSRLKDVKSALAIFNNLLKADEKSAVNRARVDAMFDGASPYNQGTLNASGQGLKTNLNFGEAQRLLDVSLSAYVDLYSSLEKLVEVKGTMGDPSEVGYFEDVVSEEITHLLRSWPEFHSSYLRLCTTFIKHGVAFSYFDNPEEWRFKIGSFADILIPRQTPSNENCIDVAVGRRNYLLHELYAFIKNPEAAEKVGWDVEEVKRVILKNATTSSRNYTTVGNNWESLQAQLKNNDIYEGHQNPTVAVLHYWVREMDGSVSHYISAEESPKTFMYQKLSRYDKPEQAYVLFTYGTGSNGTYHSIRGLGHRIFNHIQTSNRLRCQMVDGAMLGSAVMIQPESQRALDELGFTYYGAYAVLSPNVNIIEKAAPNLSTAVQPALNDISNQLAMNTDTVSTYGQQSSPYKNQMQVVADMDVQTRLSGASLNLFYASWNRLLREIVRRIVSSKKRDRDLDDFYTRCFNRGVPVEFVKSLDLDRTKAVRSIGNGSYANRLVALRELQAISGSFDEVGRKNLTRDIVATRVGHDLADRYAPNVDVDRETVDNKIAILENQQLSEGTPIPVISNEMHGAHLQIHAPALMQIIEQLNAGAADPVSSLPALQSYYQHISETVQQLAGDPAAEGLIGETKQVLQFAEEMINNTSKQVQKMQREASQSQGQESEGGSEMQTKIQEHQLKMQMAQEKANLDLQLKKAKFDQEQAMRDAENVLKMQQDMS